MPRKSRKEKEKKKKKHKQVHMLYKYKLACYLIVVAPSWIKSETRSIETEIYYYIANKCQYLSHQAS